MGLLIHIISKQQHAEKPKIQNVNSTIIVKKKEKH